MALLGVNSVAELGLEQLHFADGAPRRLAAVGSMQRTTAAA
jgi:hypothetical protein